MSLKRPAVGTPYLSDVRVTAEVLRNSKGRKIRIFKYRAKKHTRITRGHRQKYTDGQAAKEPGGGGDSVFPHALK